jgi:hypothetical protein
VVIGRESAACNYVVNVRVVAQVARPGMQHPHHADPAADEPGIRGQFL